jgi:acyl carrier protein
MQTESTMQTREEIFDTLRSVLIELFEIEPERITPAANLYTDLEIDSIDAIDLIDQVRRQTGRKLDANDFRAVRTIEDVVEAMWQKQDPAA